ncbi:hypothetical protein EMIHUDRAFT_210537 [Emiliania huxleyi CCMP1516]|uniref:HEAT repeat domain-containing protein n=2 Tax=Emiliania huxleyi TaxID=2903 RepID=A0A0D3IY98_EMIH1|nr:hypothetical protein EMIHUDRAFT_210537 [Emiliania huxleyi CCMP1516]EOD16233.1 hypothetical protein EMIHUDRAFT_210537 [Emiliania huxleyi CCMP1516]|eukprot:XP_005768662.1 hypothetical protein EMIHUDRAFT_210537 [Emiliania huxleyi CCMP1516]
MEAIEQLGGMWEEAEAVAGAAEAAPADGSDLRGEAMEALMGLLSDSDRPVRHAAAAALGRLGDRHWQAAFPQRDGPPSFEALSESPRPEVLTLLIDLLTVALPEDRRLAAQLLGLNRLNATSWTLSERACAGLRVLARDPDATVRVQALHSLGEGRDAGSLATVIGSLADSSTKVRHAAALAAGKIGDPRAQQVLVRVLTRREDVTVQAAVCAALHRLECSAGSLAALVAALLRSSGDGLEPLQRGAVAALSRWSDPAAVLAAFRQASSVLGRATTRTPDVRAAACEATAAIGKIALPKAVSPLVPMLRDPAPGVVDEARGALLRLDWSGLLRPGEAVLLSGPCLRQTTSLVGHVSMQTSMLVLCDSGRLFCVDAKARAAGEPLADTEVELDQRSSAAAPGVLALVGEGRPLPVQPVLQRPEEWEGDDLRFEQ